MLREHDTRLVLLPVLPVGLRRMDLKPILQQEYFEPARLYYTGWQRRQVTAERECLGGLVTWQKRSIKFHIILKYNQEKLRSHESNRLEGKQKW
jgi:hypothetical protein